MKIAVLSLTRDRLDYTRHCFASLETNAGCEYDHFVFDNGSTDGTKEWLTEEFETGGIDGWCSSEENIGIHRALNVLLDETDGAYDVIVNFDNDCEVLVPDTLLTVAAFAVDHPGWIVGPHTQGLRHPPAILEERTVDGLRVGVTMGIGGIFMPLPAGWRYSERAPLQGNGDGYVCAQARAQGHTCGYLLDFPVNHYETTDGQWARYPEYFERKQHESPGVRI